MPKQKLKPTYLVTKSNALNEMRSSEMSLQELRLLSVYMSKINPLDVNTVLVRFTAKEFHAIMDTKMQRIRIDYYERIAERLLHKIIKIPLKYGFEAFTLFRRVKYELNKEDGQYYFEIVASQDALPLLFDLRENYFRYELWNALRLRGKNQLRMYEIMKQHEWRGHCIISIKELKEQLGMHEYEYHDYKGFRQRVLEPCKVALLENTDISYTYEPYRKWGRKILELKFTIIKNKNHQDPLSLSDFIDQSTYVPAEAKEVSYWEMDEDEVDPDTLTRYEERMLFFRSAVNAEFTEKQMVVLINTLAEKAKHVFYNDIACYDYLKRKYDEAKLKESEGAIRHTLFAYLKSIIGR
jgi:plasmid replication initiation protein